MGNKCSLNIDKINYNENLSEYDKTIYNEKRERVFYGTIAICVIYASLALLLFLASYLSEKVKFMLLNNFLPFTIVYIIGTIIIVFYLIHQVVNFKPFKIDRNSLYDNLSCPDYWTLEKVPIKEGEEDKFKSIFSSNVVDYGLFKYRCKLNENIFDKYNLYTANSLSGYSELTATSNVPYYNYTNSTPTGNNGVVTKPADSINSHLFVNIINPNNTILSSTVNKQILQNDKNQKYELIKNTLLMNNFILIDDKNPVKVFKQADLTGIDKNNSKIDVLNFDYLKSDSATTAIQAGVVVDTADLYIKVDTSLDPIRVYKSTTSTASTSGDTLIDVLPMVCDSTYPMFLASRDEITNKTNDKFDNNTFRCAYSKICKVPWSDMNCDKYDK